MILNCVSCSGSGPGQYFVSRADVEIFNIYTIFLGIKNGGELIKAFYWMNMIVLFPHRDLLSAPYLMLREMRNDPQYELKLCASVDVWLCPGPGLHKQVASLAAAR